MLACSGVRRIMWCDSCGRRLRCAPLALCANGEGSIIHERPSVTHVWTGLRREPVRLRSASHWRARVAALKAADTPHLLWPTAAATAAAATATAATATATIAKTGDDDDDDDDFGDRLGAPRAGPARPTEWPRDYSLLCFSP